MVKDGEDSGAYTLRVEGLSRVFGTKVAVDGVSFSAKEGEIFGVVGPNGAGKTTTVRMLTTLLPPTSGVAWIMGFNIVTEPSLARRYIGYVPQAVSVDGYLTGYENLMIFAKLSGVPRKCRKERIDEILQFLGLQDAAHQLVRYYSGGMVRRLEIGQALLTRPNLLFLDEPTVGLDPVARRSVWDMLKGIRTGQSLSILITTHYMEEAESLCDRVGIMNQGKLVTVGSPEELKRATGRTDATLEDAFRFFTQESYDEGGSFRELRRTRRFARRLG